MKLRTILGASLLTLIVACDGDTGLQGPAGPVGPEGPAGPQGPAAPPPAATNEVPVSVNGLDIRSIDGFETNEQFPNIGSTFEQLDRIADSDYDDFVSSLAGSTRKSAREISNLVIDQAGASIPNSFGTSDFLWQWGQFLDHDIDLTPGGDEEAPIPVPVGDPSFDPTSAGGAELAFNRSVFDPTTGSVTGNPRQQINEITSWIDASNVYGSDFDRLVALREGAESPFLKTSDDGLLLPLNTDNFFNDNGPTGADPQTLFLAGDVRANEQIGLTVMHTLFVREHNRIAALLQAQFPDNSANEIFFLARRLVGAEMQIITFEEFLPALLGPNAIADYEGYDFLTNANIINSFSTAAFRFGHSALSPNLLRLDASGAPIAEGSVSLREAFFSPGTFLQSGADIEPFLRGLATQPHQEIDEKIIDDVRNFLFGIPGAGGLDLAALNIQRGRDHGLPSYNDMRDALGLGRAASFAEVSSDATVQANLAAAYDSVNDIDLWVGGLAEDPVIAEGSQLGETFRRLLVIKFMRLRDGDRFWYENDLTQAELDFLGDVTLAKVIRDNTSIDGEISDTVFMVPTP